MLPIKLPEKINLNTKGNPLDHQKKWKEIKINGENCTLDTDTLDTFVTLLGIFYVFVHQKIMNMVLIKKI